MATRRAKINGQRACSDLLPFLKELSRNVRNAGGRSSGFPNTENTTRGNVPHHTLCNFKLAKKAVEKVSKCLFETDLDLERDLDFEKPERLISNSDADFKTPKCLFSNSDVAF